MIGSVHAESALEESELGSFRVFDSRGDSFPASVGNGWNREEESWAFRGYETMESSLLREREGNRGIPAAEETLFGADRKRDHRQEIRGRFSDWNLVKGRRFRNADRRRHTSRCRKRSKAPSFEREREIVDGGLRKGRSSDWTGSGSFMRRLWESPRIGTGPKHEVLEA